MRILQWQQTLVVAKSFQSIVFRYVLPMFQLNQLQPFYSHMYDIYIIPEDNFHHIN